MDVDERTAQRTGFISLDKAQRHQLGGVFMDTLHIASETAREFAQADGSSVLLQGLDNRPATLREATKKGAGCLEIQGFALIRRGGRGPAGFAQCAAPIRPQGNGQATCSHGVLRFSTSAMKSSMSRSTVEKE